jgi:hypothetical protein
VVAKLGPRSVWAVPHPPRAAPICIRIRKPSPYGPICYLWERLRNLDSTANTGLSPILPPPISILQVLFRWALSCLG